VRRFRYSSPRRWGDLDAQGHVNNAVYLDYLQEARVDYLLSGPSALQHLLTTGVLVVSHQVEYLRPVTFHEEPLRIRLWVDSIGGSRFAISYEVFDLDQLAARARTTVVPFDLASNSMRRLTPEERDLFTAELHSGEPLREVTKAKVTDHGHRSPLPVRWSDLDSYGHVNNVKYYDYIQESRIAMMRDTLGWDESMVWLVVRQDLEYRRPMDFRIAPYEVVTVIADIGNRSITLAAEIRERDGSTTSAQARTVLVGGQPLTDDQRQALQRWLV
jgi:acyl-CoA thioester hydrolase